MKKLLIVVHGMGSHPPKWSDRIRDKLDAVARRYTAFQGGAAPFSSHFTFAEVRYDGVFDRYVGEWGAQADAFEAFQESEAAKQQGLRLPKLMKWLHQPGLPGDEKSVFWSTLLDPVLYRAFPIVRDEVRAAVMAQIVGHLTANMGGGALQASVLAHSLGTAVAQDVLQQLGSGAAGGNQSLAARTWTFEHLFMLANVCMLGPEGLRDVDPRDAAYVVKPKSAVPVDSPKGSHYCGWLHSYRHEWDPFVRWAPLEPTSWQADWGADFVAPAPFPQVRGANVHGFLHYLDHPTVHIPIINAMVGFQIIGPREELDAVADYPLLVSPQCRQQIDTLREIVADFPARCDDLEEIAMLGARFLAEARRAAAACRQLGGSLDE